VSPKVSQLQKNVADNSDWCFTYDQDVWLGRQDQGKDRDQARGRAEFDLEEASDQSVSLRRAIRQNANVQLDHSSQPGPARSDHVYHLCILHIGPKTRVDRVKRCVTSTEGGADQAVFTSMTVFEVVKGQMGMVSYSI
jgi:hypothetical protein